MNAPDPMPDRAHIDSLRKALSQGNEALRLAYEQDARPEKLLQGRARLVDNVLCQLWKRCALPESVTLVAVGGYGRGELFPCSDVDILVLMPGTEADEALRSMVERYIGFLWDLGLDIGHSVRTVATNA